VDEKWRTTPDGLYIRPDGRIYLSPGGKAQGQRAVSAYREASIVRIVPCESTRGEWGGVCPDCHRRLPNPGPLRSWASQHHLGTVV